VITFSYHYHSQGQKMDALALFPVPQTDLATLDERARTRTDSQQIAAAIASGWSKRTIL
jgi:hypothetical protein